MKDGLLCKIHRAMNRILYLKKKEEKTFGMRRRRRNSTQQHRRQRRANNSNVSIGSESGFYVSRGDGRGEVLRRCCSVRSLSLFLLTHKLFSLSAPLLGYLSLSLSYRKGGRGGGGGRLFCAARRSFGVRTAQFSLRVQHACSILFYRLSSRKYLTASTMAIDTYIHCGSSSGYIV